MPSKKLWIYNEISNEAAKKLSRSANISTLLSKVLINRKIDKIEDINKFINPSLEDLHDPFLMKDMDKAVQRIIKALNQDEKILVYGDYDVDGVTSTSILYSFLKSQKARLELFIPDRFAEGYGLSLNSVEIIKKFEARLLITVDCGVASIEEVNLINKSGIDVIITDHHECRNELPNAIAVVNPCRNDCQYPFKKLAGVGIVFKLINALCISLNLGNVHYDYLDMVAIGTVADVVPLLEENRIIVSHGLKMIENTSNRGISSLAVICALKDKPINSWTIGFVLAPRINAAGRIGNALRAVKLFTTVSDKEAMDIAAELDGENKFRQDTEQEIIENVIEMIEMNLDLNKEKVIVAAGEGWHHGIIGIVASKISERYYRPCLLICIEDGIGKGSGRSIEGFNLFNALNCCEDLLDKYGGHELAAGLTIKAENIKALRERINIYAHSILDRQNLTPKLRIDTKLTIDDLKLDAIREIELLAPFGAGNPSPVFSYEGFRIQDIRAVGENKHLKLSLEDKKLYVDAIGFNMGNYVRELKKSDKIDVACSLEINTWNSIQKVQLNLKDIRDNIEDTIPDRTDLLVLFKYFKKFPKDDFLIEDMLAFSKAFTEAYKSGMNYSKLDKSITILEELSLLTKTPSGENGMIIKVNKEPGIKVNLEDSALYRFLQQIKLK